VLVLEKHESIQFDGLFEGAGAPEFGLGNDMIPMLLPVEYEYHCIEYEYENSLQPSFKPQ